MNDDPKTSVRSCTSCRARKIRCDKLKPSCHACAKNRLSCEYPTAVRRAAPRPRRDVALMQRLVKLEAVIGELSGAGGGTSMGGLGGAGSESDTGGGSLETWEGGDAARGLGELEAGLGRLLVSEGKSRYIGPKFWASLSEEVGFVFLLLFPCFLFSFFSFLFTLFASPAFGGSVRMVAETERTKWLWAEGVLRTVDPSLA